MAVDISERARHLYGADSSKPNYAVELRSFVEQLEGALVTQPGAFSVSSTEMEMFRLFSVLALKVVTPDKDGFCRISPTEWNPSRQWTPAQRIIEEWKAGGFVGVGHIALGGLILFQVVDQRPALEDIGHRVNQRLEGLDLISEEGNGSNEHVRPQPRFVVEAIFLIYLDGRPIAQEARAGPAKEVDAASIGSMLSAIKDFAKDTVGALVPLNALEFGDSRFLFERGKNCTLAVSVFGDSSSAVSASMREELNKLEVTLGTRLEKWDGNTDVAAACTTVFAKLFSLSTVSDRTDASQSSGGPKGGSGVVAKKDEGSSSPPGRAPEMPGLSPYTFPAPSTNQRIAEAMAHVKLASAGRDRQRNVSAAIDLLTAAIPEITDQLERDLTEGNLALALMELAPVKDRELNLGRAAAILHGLEGRLKANDLLLGKTQTNLASVHISMADGPEREKHTIMAISAGRAALASFEKAGEASLPHAAWINLGSAYRALAEIRETSTNCRKALDAYEHASKLVNAESSPFEFAAIQNNNGSTLLQLALVSERHANLEKAIKAFTAALTVYRLGEFPAQYASTQASLAAAYRLRAETTDTEENVKLAVFALKAALRVFSITNNPREYARVHKNLSATYLTLARAKREKRTLQQALAACDEALKVYNVRETPLDYASMQDHRGIAFTFLAAIEDAEQNLVSGIDAFDDALKVRTVDATPMLFAGALQNKGVAMYELARLRKSQTLTKEAIAAFETVLSVRAGEQPSLHTAGTQFHLGLALCYLAELEQNMQRLQTGFDWLQIARTNADAEGDQAMVSQIDRISNRIRSFLNRPSDHDPSYA